MSSYFVYLHTFPNGKKYVGITMQSLEARFQKGNGYKKCPKMWGAIQKYGWENVEHEVLYSGLSKMEAEKLEIALIKKYDSVENGYNIQHGGNTSGTHNIETRRKISLGNKGKKKPPLSEEAKKKISLANRGVNHPFYGTKRPESIGKKHSEFMKGNQYNKGNHHTEEFKRIKSKQMKEKYSNGGNPRCKRVYCLLPNGEIKEYCSLSEGARENNLSKAWLCQCINNNRKVNGNLWGYCHE